MSLEKKLARWSSQGLISADQARAILRFEAEHGGSRVGWVVWSLLALGAVTVLTGLVAVIASNWDQLSDGLKLTGGLLLLLSSLGGAAWGARFASPWPRDLFLLLHQGLVLAMIALVAQVYHLSGAPWRPFAVAAGFALPAAILGTSSLLTDVLLGYATAGLLLLLGSHEILQEWNLAALLAGLAFAWSAAVGPLERVRESMATALRRWSAAALTASVVTAAFVWYADWRELSHVWAPPVARFDAIHLFLIAAGAAYLIEPVRRWGKSLLPYGVVVGLTVLFAAAPALGVKGLGSASADWGHTLAGFALFCGIGVAQAMVFAEQGSRVGAQAATLAVAIRVLVLYGELLKDLMFTGVGLILTGFIFLAIAYGWWRLHRLLPVNPVGSQPGGAP